MTGIGPGKSHGQGPWVSWRRHRLDDKLVGKQEDTFLLDILMNGGVITGDAKAGALKARVTSGIRWFMCRPSWPLYSRPGLGESIYNYK